MKIVITRVDISPSSILNGRGLGSDRRAIKYLASTVARYCEPYVPMSAGSGAHLKNQAQIAPDGSKITYPGPYAHYQHYGEVMAGRAPKQYTGRALDYHGAPMRGKEWEKRMMADRAGDVETDFANYLRRRGK